MNLSQAVPMQADWQVLFAVVIYVFYRKATHHSSAYISKLKNENLKVCLCALKPPNPRTCVSISVTGGNTKNKERPDRCVVGKKSWVFRFPAFERIQISSVNVHTTLREGKEVTRAACKKKLTQLRKFNCSLDFLNPWILTVQRTWSFLGSIPRSQLKLTGCFDALEPRFSDYLPLTTAK